MIIDISELEYEREERLFTLDLRNRSDCDFLVKEIAIGGPISIKGRSSTVTFKHEIAMAQGNSLAWNTEYHCHYIATFNDVEYKLIVKILW